MPAAKPKDLIIRAETKAKKSKRASSEASVTPKYELPQVPPAQLKGDIERATWQETVILYFTLDARIISQLDRGLLLDFCVATQQLAEIDQLRQKTMKNYLQAQQALDRAYDREENDAKALASLKQTVNWDLDEIIKLDGRADNKRKLLHTLRQSLYLTPRSRAGYVPPEKPPKEPRSKEEEIIDG